MNYEDMNHALIPSTLNSGPVEADYDLPQQLPDVVIRVAGAIAHDLNNALMVISSYCELMLETMPEGDPRRNYAGRMQAACHKAMQIGATISTLSYAPALAADALDFDAAVADLIPVLAGIV